MLQVHFSFPFLIGVIVVLDLVHGPPNWDDVCNEGWDWGSDDDWEPIGSNGAYEPIG